MERTIRGISQLTRGREFASEEEFRSFLRKASQGDHVEWKPETPVEQAQELVYKALETPRGAGRVRLAMDALRTSQDCADAYVLLAEEAAETLDQATAYYRRGVDAGQRALGEGAFRRYRGHFWGLVETRPYMRAVEGLAYCLLMKGERETAVGHFQDMLRLNPNDNQGVRYALVTALLETEQTDKAEKLLRKYKTDISTGWLFSRALAHFRRSGDSAAARNALHAAMAGNRHVVSYLLGRRTMPRSLPDSFSPGDETEAWDYVAANTSAWATASGALDWLEEQSPGLPATQEHSRKGSLVAGPPAPSSGGKRPKSAPQPTSQLGFDVPPDLQPPGHVDDSVSTMDAPPSLEEWRRLYEAAVGFREQAPWRWMGDDEIFGIEDPETGEIGYCCVTGRLGEVFALGVYPGAEGYEAYRRLAEEESDPEELDAALSLRCLMATFEDRSALTNLDLATIRQLGLHFRGRGVWPQFRSVLPGSAPWYLTSQESRTLASALEQATETVQRVERGLDVLQGREKGIVLVRRWDPLTKGWRDSWEPAPSPQPGPASAFTMSDARARDLRQKIAQSSVTWEVELSHLPEAVQERGQRPYFPRVWLCVEAQSGFIMAVKVLEPWRSPDELREAFLTILEEAPALPSEVRTARPDTRELLRPVAERLGMVVVQRRRLPALARAKKAFDRFIGP